MASGGKYKTYKLKDLEETLISEEYSDFISYYVGIQSNIIQIKILNKTIELMDKILIDFENNELNDNISIFSKFISFLNSNKLNEKLDSDTIERWKNLTLGIKK